MDDRKKTLRFGLMVNSLTVEYWQYETIKLLTDNGMKLSLIIQNNSNEDACPFFKKIKDYPYKRLFFRLWNRFIFKPKSKYPCSIEKITEDVHTIFCTPIIKGISSYFNDIDIQEIKNQNLDFILRFGFDIVRGEVLNTTKYGIWSFHHDDERIIRGGPPGFWEFMRKIHNNGIILQKLTNSLDKGIVIKRVNFKTVIHSYKAHLDQLYLGGISIPLQVCNDIIINGIIKEEPSTSEAKIVHPPKNIQMIQYFCISLWRRIAFHLNDLFRQEDWNVAYCNCSIKEFLSTDDKDNIDIKWFKKPKRNCYFADPFVIKTKRDTYIFFEWYSYTKGKADIAVALKSEDFQIYHKISSFKEHRSYPFVFEYNNIIYCLPEAYNTNTLTLYKFNEDSLSLEKDTDLLTGFPIVDATLLHHNEKWYIFLVNQKVSHTHLEIYISDNLKGKYIKYFNNPVMIDCSKARPAGKIFTLDDKILRPSQNCTKHYGQEITLEEIIQLTDTNFITKPHSIISPIKKSQYRLGIHTINSCDDITVIDGKRFIFTFAGLKQQLKQKFHR